MTPEIVPIEASASDIACDVLLLPAFSNPDGIEVTESGKQIDEALDGALLRHLAAAGFQAKLGEIELLTTLGEIPAETIAIVGVGPRAQAKRREIRKATASAVRRFTSRSILASAMHEVEVERAAAGSVEGMLLGSYSFDTHKSAPTPGKIHQLQLIGGDEHDLKLGRITGEAMILARDLTNEPAMAIFPESLAARARELADVHGLEAEVWDERELEQRGFGGVLGVGAGSARPPRLIQLRYTPAGADASVAIVGKGVTFDSGGLSIKTAEQMETMKTDKAGAAAVLSSIVAVARLELPIRVTAIVPAVENLPGPTAIKPGDVITHYGGKTSEVLNTDAEGRLILADALSYASELGHDAIIDVATLTGSMVIALGRKATGFFSNDETLAQQIEAAAERAGEQFWRLPLLDDYRKDLDSDVADIKNQATRYGGSIYAALFLRNFLREGAIWGHFDIAGTARSENEATRGATGVATATLIEFLSMRAGL